MSIRSKILLLALGAAAALSCKEKNEVTPTDVSQWRDLIINEIAAHDQTADAETWIELYNAGSSSVDLTGLGLYITDKYFTDQRIWTAEQGSTLPAGGRLIVSTADETLVTGISSADPFVLKLAVEDGTAVEEFDSKAVFAEQAACFARGSYQRIPDGGQTWRNLTYSSKGTENTIWSASETHHTAFWAWSSHVASMMADDAASLKSLKKLGYDHIILNYAAFEYGNRLNTLAFIEQCEELGISVHAWLQCFYKNGSWVNPVDDDNNRYKEEVFEDIRSRAKTYIEDFGVKGLHLDYIRFGGTASKHNPSAEVNAVGAVTRCCRELRELVDSYDDGLMTSAALMPEPNTEYAYGQSPSRMGKYIHVLMPMLYRYTYGWNDSRCKSLTNWFVDNGGDADVWAGITSYTGNDSGGVKGMDAAGIRKDIDIFMDSKAKGLVLFRYGLGVFPDVTDL